MRSGDPDDYNPLDDLERNNIGCRGIILAILIMFLFGMVIGAVLIITHHA